MNLDLKDANSLCQQLVIPLQPNTIVPDSSEFTIFQRLKLPLVQYPVSLIILQDEEVPEDTLTHTTRNNCITESRMLYVSLYALQYENKLLCKLF